MGSAAPKLNDPARDLLQAVHACIQEYLGAGEDVDNVAVATLLADALETPSTRCAVLLGLAEYISRTIQGCAPDLECWAPPAPTLNARN